MNNKIQSFFLVIFLLFACLGFARAEVSPVSENEINEATDHFISLLEKTKYFDFVDSRIHGFPKLENQNKNQPFWWGTYWSGVNVIKKNGLVTYLHSAAGADNNGLRTASYLESTCFAYALSKNPRYIPLIRKMVRGFSSWVLASDQISKPDYPKILSRAHYSENILSTENGRNIYFDYSLNRPGIDNTSTKYVHIPDNPTFGDIWIKNERSRDDIGRIITSIALVKTCEDIIGEDGKNDILQMRELYSKWAKDVDGNKFEITTLDKVANYQSNQHTMLERFINNLSSTSNYAIHLLRQDNPGSFKLKNSDYFFETLVHKYVQNNVFEMVRSFDLAALGMAYTKPNNEDIPRLQRRIQRRVSRDMKYYTGELKSNRIHKNDIPTMFMNANNLGTRLNDDEIRVIYDKLKEADLAMPDNDPTYHLFDVSTPDGEYSYDPTNSKMEFRSIGVLLGTCSSKFRNKEIRPLIACEKVKDYLGSF